MIQTQKILFIGSNSRFVCQELIALGYEGMSFLNVSKSISWLEQMHQFKKQLPDIIMCDDRMMDGSAFTVFEFLKFAKLEKQVTFIILSKIADRELQRKAYDYGIDDIFLLPANAEDIHYRLNIITVLKNIPKSSVNAEAYTNNKVAVLPLKRIFDAITSGLALVALSPFLGMIALLIKLDSKGPIFYISKRAGKSYKVFNFYKFRTMRTNADKELQELAKLNQYKENASFIKIENDPRVTRLGRFLRNTSLDELPQLFNVLKGDMSLIGNRPLPLYEAELLTTDDWALRFLAPAGITGLWQVTKRGQKDMTDLERKKLDTEYAKTVSFGLDYKIFRKTFAALRQTENV